MDARRKLQEIAAKTHGGSPEEYEVANERVVHKAKGAGMTFAEAARRASRARRQIRTGTRRPRI